MKILIIGLICFLSFGFVANNWTHIKGERFVRGSYERTRPFADKFAVHLFYKIDLDKFKLNFFDNDKLSGVPSLVWDNEGFKKGKEVICGWSLSKDNKPIVDPKCPLNVPVGTATKRKLGGEDLNTLDDDVVKHNNECCNVITIIETDRFVGNAKGDKMNGDVGVISYEGQEYFYDYKTLEQNKWRKNHGVLCGRDELTKKHLNNPGFKKLFNGMKQCVQKRDPVCMEKYSQTGFRVEMKIKWSKDYIIKGKDKILKFWQYFFNEEFERREFDHIFSQTAFPCISVVDSYSTGKDSLIVSGEEYYIEFEKRFGSKDPNDWRFSEIHYMDNQAYPEGMKYCDVKIHPTPVPEPTIALMPGAKMKLYEFSEYQKDKKILKMKFNPKEWLDAYRRLQVLEGKGLSRQEWNEKYKKNEMRTKLFE